MSYKAKNKENSDLTHKAYGAIRQMLFYNEIHPGQKIKYQDLADRIGVSMTPVIQALKWLEFRNIVRHEPNRGYYINEVSLTEVTEIYNTRLLIESSLVSEIIGKLDQNGITKIQISHKSYHAAVDESNCHKRLIADMQFHMTLASLSKNRIQLNILQGLFDILLLRYSQNLFMLSVMDTSLTEHAFILEQLENKDKKGLTQALSDHITIVRDHIAEGMSRTLSTEKVTLLEDYSV